MNRSEEIQRNLAHFKARLPDLLNESGKFALLRHEKIVGFYDSAGEAIGDGNSKFPDLIFSIQEVKLNGVNLGFYSHAVHLGIS